MVARHSEIRGTFDYNPDSSPQLEPPDQLLQQPAKPNLLDLRHLLPCLGAGQHQQGRCKPIQAARFTLDMTDEPIALLRILARSRLQTLDRTRDRPRDLDAVRHRRKPDLGEPRSGVRRAAAGEVERLKALALDQLGRQGIVRARRRYEELFQKGVDSSLGDVLADQTKRDKDDSSREVAPLKPADDAVQVDSSAIPLSEVVQTLEREVQKRLSARG